MEEDISALTPYDMRTVLEDITEEKPKHSRTKKPITQSWKHYKLKCFFATQHRAFRHTDIPAT